MKKILVALFTLNFPDLLESFVDYILLMPQIEYFEMVDDQLRMLRLQELFENV